ncbi:MAG: hypothetical protein WB987_03480 [Candidatus Acidiferrales bacterium]
MESFLQRHSRCLREQLWRSMAAEAEDTVEAVEVTLAAGGTRAAAIPVVVGHLRQALIAELRSAMVAGA